MAVVARYLFNEAASGTGPATIADDTGNGGDLTINYSSGDAVWFEDAQGRGLDFTAAPVASDAAVATLTNVSANGSLGSSFSNVTRFAFVIKTDLDAGHSFGSRIFQIGTDTGNGELALIDGEFAPSLRLNGVGVVDLPNLDGNTNNIAYVEVDTSGATAADRITVYYGNVEQSLANNTIALNQSINLNNASYNLTVGNRGDGNRGVDGRIKYLAFYDDHLTAQQRNDLFTGLASNDDIDPLAEPPNVGPVADDATYSIQTDAQNGDVIATYAATDSDGTIASYSLDNAVLAITNAGVVTLADNSGLVAGTPIIANVTATDNDGDTDVARITVNVTAPAFRIDSITAAPIRMSDSIVIQHSNASISGRSYLINGQPISADSESSAQSTITVPNVFTFGNQTLSLNTDLTLQVVDGVESDTVTFQIVPGVGDDYDQIAAIAGGWAEAGFEDVQVGMNAYVIGDGIVDIPSGSFEAGYTYTVNVQDSADDVWSSTSFIAPSVSPVPVITLAGGSTINHPHGSTYVDPGYTATDSVDGVITNDVQITGVVNVNDVGQYILSYDVINSTNDSAQTVFRTVNVVDQTAPVISLIGPASVSHTLGLPYTDLGATASDAVDGNLTSSLVPGGFVDVNNTGSYTVTYDVNDAAGNAAQRVTRTVTVTLDGEAPVITLLGGAVSLNVGDQFSEPGFSAVDNVDGDITDRVVIGGDVIDTSTAGFYVRTYNVTDTAGNDAVELNRLVTVNASIDVSAPNITLLGDNPLTLTVGDSYLEPGYTALDNLDGTLTSSVQVSDTLDTNTLGSYSLLYTVDDAAGNTGQAIRVVNVIPEGLTVQTPQSRTVYIRPGSERIDVFVQDSSDYFDYVMDFSAKLQGDPIASVQVSTEKVAVDRTNFEGQQVQVWVSGGKERDQGVVTITATTIAGRRIERSFEVKVGEY